jgi:hypothetical protein
MAAQVFCFLADNLPKPLLDSRIVHVVVVYPILVASVVRWVYVDTFDLTSVSRQQSLQRFEVITFNEQILSVRVSERKIGVAFQQPRRDMPMMINDSFFANPVECWHPCSLLVFKSKSCSVSY